MKYALRNYAVHNYALQTTFILSESYIVMTPPETPDERTFVQQHLDRGDATGWFDKIYANAQGDGKAIPWACLTPRPSFADWLAKATLDDYGKRAAVVGCGASLLATIRYHSERVTQ